MIRTDYLRIGDWVLTDGKPIQIAAIHLRKVAYHETKNRLRWVRSDRLEHITLTDETLRDFGFTVTDEYDARHKGNVWKFSSERIANREADTLYLSGTEYNCDGVRSYHIICRGYIKVHFLDNDSISDLQHFFADFNGCPLPLRYREQDGGTWIDVNRLGVVEVKKNDCQGKEDRQ